MAECFQHVIAIFNCLSRVHFNNEWVNVKKYNNYTVSALIIIKE